ASRVFGLPTRGRQLRHTLSNAPDAEAFDLLEARAVFLGVVGRVDVEVLRPVERAVDRDAAEASVLDGAHPRPVLASQELDRHHPKFGGVRAMGRVGWAGANRVGGVLDDDPLGAFLAAGVAQVLRKPAGAPPAGGLRRPLLAEPPADRLRALGDDGDGIA